MVRIAPILALALLLPAAARGQPRAGAGPGTVVLDQDIPEGEDAPADSVRVIDPDRALLRSALVPGWGQFYVGKPLKGVVFMAGAGTFLGLVLHADGRVEDLAARRDPALSVSERADLEADIERWRVQRRRWILWTAGLWLYSLADAYVDAHLADFDREEPRFEVTTVPPPGAAAPPPCWLGIRLTIGPPGGR